MTAAGVTSDIMSAIRAWLQANGATQSTVMHSCLTMHFL